MLQGVVARSCETAQGETARGETTRGETTQGETTQGETAFWRKVALGGVPNDNHQGPAQIHGPTILGKGGVNREATGRSNRGR
ncbi:hypothetical protein [Limnothrix redekei]|uniref:Uncharacterized protein n=1 Tax=Limnothrix redekei LRLZ20PSL1 TaxID=3112953 RepID=A0ABW7CEU0_9CYAN